jgi:hypothetical protein
MIAVALGLLSLVVMIATGVAASSGGDDHLTFLGVGVQTTTAQVFLTGAIFGWVFVIALWLLRVGIHRSAERCAQLAARRGRRAREWLGFREAEPDGWHGWDEWDAMGRRPGPESRFSAGAAHEPVDRLRDGIVGGTGTARHGGGAPGRADRGADDTDWAVAVAPDQPGPLGGGHPPSPVAGRFPGIGVDGGAECRQIGGGAGSMPGEDRGSQGEYRAGEGGQ